MRERQCKYLHLSPNAISLAIRALVASRRRVVHAAKELDTLRGDIFLKEYDSKVAISEASKAEGKGLPENSETHGLVLSLPLATAARLFRLQMFRMRRDDNGG